MPACGRGFALTPVRGFGEALKRRLPSLGRLRRVDAVSVRVLHPVNPQIRVLRGAAIYPAVPRHDALIHALLHLRWMGEVPLDRVLGVTRGRAHGAERYNQDLPHAQSSALGACPQSIKGGENELRGTSSTGRRVLTERGTHKGAPGALRRGPKCIWRLRGTDAETRPIDCRFLCRQVANRFSLCSCAKPGLERQGKERIS